MTGITVLKSNVPHGPFTRAEIAQKLVSGEITSESLAFVEGLAQWTPLREVIAKVDAMPSAHAPIGTGFGVEQKIQPATTAPIGAGYSYAASMAPPNHLVYAGFWLRTIAFLIDLFFCIVVGFVVGLVAGVLIWLLTAAIGQDAAVAVASVAHICLILMTLLLQWLYFALLESSRFQATLGKMALSLRVTDREGNRISFSRATGRYFGKIISGIPLYIGFMMAGWTERKQALHDMIADTLVVRKPGS